MLRFISGNLTTIDRVNIYPIFSLLVFVTVFTIVIIRVLRMKKADVVELGNLPFQDAVETNDGQARNLKN